MELRVYFRLRAGQQTRPGKKQLYVRLTVEGETSGDYGSGVYVRPALWDQSNQQCSGRTKEAAEVNERLSEIELEHRAILREMKARYARGEGTKPNAEQIKAEFLTPGASDPDLLVFYARYYAYQNSLVGTEDGKARKTLDRMQTSVKYLTGFVPYFCQQNSVRGRLTLRTITTAFGKQYHAWLQIKPETQKRQMQKDSANKYLGLLRDCLSHAIDSDLLTENPLDKFRPTRGKLKPIYFLSDDHIDRLFEISTNDEAYQNVLWWVRLMCYTGLDYADAVLYARNRAVFERKTPDGTIIYIQRAKPPRNYCEIPLHPIVEVLFGMHSNGPTDYHLNVINRYMLIVESEIGFEKRFTTKICRKTAGAIYLRAGYQMGYVSKLLGHRSIRTTEQHYVGVGALSMQTEMKRVKSMNHSKD